MDDEGVRSDNEVDAACLSDIAILEALDGESDEATRSHLASCPECARRATRMRRFQHTMHVKLYRLFCPSSDLLLEYRQGWLSRQQSEEVARHLANCPHCAREMSLLERSLGSPELSQGPGSLFAARPLRRY